MELNDRVPDNSRSQPLFKTDLGLQGRLGRLFGDSLRYDYPLEAGKDCGGLSLPKDGEAASPPTAGCGRLIMLIPRPKSIGVWAPTLSDVRDVTQFVNVGQDLNVVIRGVALALQECKNAVSPDLASRCSGLSGNPNVPSVELRDAQKWAFGIEYVLPLLADAELQARQIIARAGGAVPTSSPLLDPLTRTELRQAAHDFVCEFQKFNKLAPCAAEGEPGEIDIPERFKQVVQEDRQVRIYDISPHEQTQRASASLRMANAVSLAAAVAAQAPGSGIGASGGIGFARNAAGRADLIERAPLVVSFAEVGTPITDRASFPLAGVEDPPASASPLTFGWLLGPRLGLGADGKSLTLDQSLRTYDLSVDLSVPGWWPYLTLHAETAWAPNWQQDSARTAGDAPARSVRVPLSPNGADLTALTSLLTGNSLIRSAAITSLEPNSISSCKAAVELQILGENIWRADSVIIGGRRFSGSDIRVLPDMRGLTVSVAKGAFPATVLIDGQHHVVVTVPTPYGPAVEELRIAEKDCEAQSAATPQAPTVSEVQDNRVSACDVGPEFIIIGARLNQVAAVRLGGRRGRWTARENGNTATAEFPALNVRQVFGDATDTQLHFEKADGTVLLSKPVAITSCKTGD